MNLDPYFQKNYTILYDRFFAVKPFFMKIIKQVTLYNKAAFVNISLTQANNVQYFYSILLILDNVNIIIY